MGPVLLAVLLLASPAARAPPPSARTLMASRSESMSAVETSAAQRFRSGEAATRPQVADADALARSRSGAEGQPDGGRTGDRFGFAPAIPLSMVGPARWVDSLPVKVDVQDGGVLLTLRFRAP